MLQSFKFYRKLRGGLWIKTMERGAYDDIYTWHHIKDPGLSIMGKVLSDHKIQGVIVQYEYYGEVSPWEIQAFIDCERIFEKDRIGHGNIQNLSDGYHSFKDLYEHRNRLFAVLSNLATHQGDLTTWKSRKNADGSEWEGWFVAGFKSDKITYHLPNELWNEMICPQIEKGLWDGHKSSDVLNRLYSVNMMILSLHKIKDHLK